MVHALKEIWRVLKPDGALLDLRPYNARWPLEIRVGDAWAMAGRFDDTPSLPDDQASDDAMAAVEGAGLYVRQRQARFEFFYYWDTLDEMSAYIAERWAPSVILPDAVLREARRLTETRGEGARVRGRLVMHIALWRKKG